MSDLANSEFVVACENESPSFFQRLPFKKRNFLILGSLIFIFFIISLFGLYHSIRSPYLGERANKTLFTVERGESLTHIAERLEQEGMIYSAKAFKWFVILQGKGASLKSGQYQVEGAISFVDLLAKLEKGAGFIIGVTLIEGQNLRESFASLNAAGIVNDGNYWSLNEDKEFLRSLNLFGTEKSLEGFLFPDTYHLDKMSSKKLVVKTMVDEFFDRLPANFVEAGKKMGLTPYEAVILASIIEKETGNPQDRGLISSVFHNRLRKGIRLQTDPTVIYGIKNFKGNLTKRHLRTKTPYNTYTFRGLPPTPIANPGYDALYAAVNPLKSKYLYFVAMGNGKTKFSATYREHVNAVNKYQRRGRNRKTYRSF